VTMNPADLYVFKVPKTLPEAVRIMARVQLGKTLSDWDAETIVAFLSSLTGNLPRNFAEFPVLPPAGFAPTKGADVGSGDNIHLGKRSNGTRHPLQQSAIAWGTCEYGRSEVH